MSGERGIYFGWKFIGNGRSQKADFYSGIFKKFRESFKMRPRQYFGGRHVSRLHAVFRDKVRGGGRHRGFAGANIALQKPVHWMPRLKVFDYVVYRAKLRFGRLKIEEAQKFFF